MNVVIMNNDQKISDVITLKEAEARLKNGLVAIYPKAKIVHVDDEISQKRELNIVAEVIEERGCAGGGCSL